MNRQINEKPAAFRPAAQPGNGAGMDVECYVSAMLNKRAYTPDPMLLALRGLGVNNTTIGAATSSSKSFITHVAAGRRPLPEAMRPQVLVLLSQALMTALSAMERAKRDPRFPEKEIEQYEERISEAEQVLKECRS